MITGPDGAAVLPAVPDEIALPVVEALVGSAVRFVLDPDRAGIDLCVDNLVRDVPNRARIKVFAPQPGTVVVFLYKDSQVPFSADRFSYGALVARRAPPPPGNLRAAIGYAVSGLHPEHRPACVKRTFPFTVPR